MTLALTLPPTVELCARPFNDGVCAGLIYRPQPETIVCGRCGGSEAGVVYRRTDLPQGESVEGDSIIVSPALADKGVDESQS